MTTNTLTPLGEGTWKGLIDLKIAKLLTDVANQSPTYDNWYDCKIQSVEPFKAVYDDQELTADNMILDSDVTLKQIDFSMTIATLDLDVLALIDGSTTHSAGSGDNATVTNMLGADDKPNYFKLEFSTDYDKDPDIADKHVTLWKCKAKLEGAAVLEKDKGYTIFTISGRAIPIEGTITFDGIEKENCIRTIRHFKTAQDIDDTVST